MRYGASVMSVTNVTSPIVRLLIVAAGIHKLKLVVQLDSTACPNDHSC